MNIYSGTVNATGGANAAGIEGVVDIRGGRITANGGSGGAGINGTANIAAGVVTATGDGSGAGINGATTIGGGLVEASGVTGINGASVTVNNGIVRVTGTSTGIGGTVTLAEGLMLQGGANSDAISAIAHDAKQPYMTVTEQVYTIFYKDSKGWSFPYVTYTYADGGETTEEMSRDGEYWRITVKHKPLTLTFFEAVAHKEQNADNGTVTVKEATAQQTGITPITVTDGNAPDGTTISGFGSFFVMEGGCRMVTFVYGDHMKNHSGFVCVQVNDGLAVVRPSAEDEEPATGYNFLRWERDGWATVGTGEDAVARYVGGAYNFSASVTQSMTLYAVYEKQNYTVTFDGGDTKSVPYLGTVAKPATPSGGTPTRVFQKWVLAETVNTLDKDGNPLTLAKDTAYNFDTPVTCNLKLKSEWKHVHVYEKVTYQAYVGRAFIPETDTSYHNTMHVIKCTGCNDMHMEPHSFDTDDTCTVCGFKRSDKLYQVTFYSSDGGRLYMLSVKEGTNVYFPTGIFSYGNFQAYIVRNHDTGALLKTETNCNMSIFTIGACNTDIYETYRERYSFPKSSVTLTTSASGGNMANLDLSWNLSMGDFITSAGVLTTTNAELQKYNYSFWTKQKTLDTSNLLKKNQNGGYDGGLRSNMQSRMLSGSSYDPNIKATIHDFPVRSLSRIGSYTVPHELPTGNKATKYGQWVYAMGYVKYMDSQGNMRTIYTNPVAVSVSDPAHTVEYTIRY